ncbi:MAG: ParB/RepB/Spo0J family partition protein [Clostridiales bacterium]|nr:ParB/RepB/Spo0J family partition protein [Clostridiales bacterium]
MNKETKNTVTRTAKTNNNIENKSETTEIKTAVMTTPKPKSLIIKLEDLIPFKNHPYKVIENESLIELTESIAANGILNPLLVRPAESEKGKYEIISGHRRFYAAQKIGMRKVPCTVHFIDRDAATVMMVDSNCQRVELLPSEKAKAYKMKMDAMKRQGKRTDLKADGTSSPVATKSDTAESIGAKENISRDQVYRYIRLNYLVPELLQFVDEGKIGMRPAVEMSYLDEEVQRDIVDCIDESGGEIFPSHAQTRRIREIAAAKGKISYVEVKAIIEEKKPNQTEKVKIPTDELIKRIGKNMTDDEFIKYLYKAVECYKQYLARQRDRDAR